MHAIAFAAGEVLDALLLVAAAEVEPTAIGAAVHVALAEGERGLATADDVEHALVFRERVASLVDVRDLHGLAELEDALVGLLLADEHLEERCLAGAVRSDDADDARPR